MLGFPAEPFVVPSELAYPFLSDLGRQCSVQMDG